MTHKQYNKRTTNPDMTIGDGLDISMNIKARRFTSTPKVPETLK